jgi:hypothetical protein
LQQRFAIALSSTTHFGLLLIFDTGGEILLNEWIGSTQRLRGTIESPNHARFYPMSLKPQARYIVPAETAKVARAVFREGTLCLTMADILGEFLGDQNFSALFPAKGQPAESPWRLALVTILQYLEGLTDRQAADAVRGRMKAYCISMLFWNSQ